jgi:2-methylaconitate cis-trans-isomerase PrpF
MLQGFLADPDIKALPSTSKRRPILMAVIDSPDDLAIDGADDHSLSHIARKSVVI